jgi:hypothetical protein
MNILKQMLTGERNLPGEPFTQKELDAEVAIVRAEAEVRQKERMKNWTNLEETWERDDKFITTTAIEGMEGHLGDIINGHMMMTSHGWTLVSTKRTPYELVKPKEAKD